MPDIVVLGIGNQYAGNDSAGVIVARMLREKLPPSITVMECSSAFDALMNSPDCSVMIVVDSFLSENPGSLLIETRERKNEEYETFQIDPHDIDVDKLLNLLWLFKKSLKKILFIGIGVNEIDLGEGIASAVSSGIDLAVNLIMSEIGKLSGE
jgi:hydrogenase maturation protease